MRSTKSPSVQMRWSMCQSSGCSEIPSSKCLAVVCTISEQSGSVVHALANTKRTWDQPQSIGGVYAQKLTGRENTEQVIYYFSVGLGIQDAALAEFILANGKF